MKQELYVVREDSTIELMNIEEDEIVNMIGSDYYPAIFRVTSHGIEYANVDLSDETFEWKRSMHTGE
jgi:hypothetical protein